jgi:ATP-dependent Clp protease ATP-binding subunit ClpC
LGTRAFGKAATAVFERFTDRARMVVVRSQAEARALHHDQITPEHILLGLTGDGAGLAVRALEALGISPDTVREQVEEAIGPRQPGESPSSGHIPFTPQAKDVLAASPREARALGHGYIGTEHILLGLISAGDGTATQVLTGLGADYTRVRAQVIRLLGEFRQH